MSVGVTIQYFRHVLKEILGGKKRNSEGKQKMQELAQLCAWYNSRQAAQLWGEGEAWAAPEGRRPASSSDHLGMSWNQTLLKEQSFPNVCLEIKHLQHYFNYPYCNYSTLILLNIWNYIFSFLFKLLAINFFTKSLLLNQVHKWAVHTLIVWLSSEIIIFPWPS